MAHQAFMNWNTGLLDGPEVTTTLKTLGELRPIFADQAAAAAMPSATKVYRVQIFAPVAPGLKGGLFWGQTEIQPGKVGNEYFMTKGHFHEIRNRGEYYAAFQGAGILLLMDEARVTRSEAMTSGSIHYIPGDTAHRVVNTGSVPLVFSACWPSDAGHDYESIAARGFSARVIELDGVPTLVAAD